MFDFMENVLEMNVNCDGWGWMVERVGNGEKDGVCCRRDVWIGKEWVTSVMLHR